MATGGSVNDILKQMKKDHGDKIVSTGAECIDFVRIPTGIYPMDMALGGGFPQGKMSMIFGPESCLDGSTFIPYEVWAKDGKRQNHKGGSIERLYHRFHNIPRPGKGNYQKKQSVGSDFYVKSINEFGAVVKNLVLNVVDTGKKPCFQVNMSSGETIVATADHKFFTGSGFTELKNLIPGDTVYVHNNTRYKGKKVPNRYHYDYVNWHPNGTKVVREGKYVYYQIARCRLVVEAKLNGLSYNQYKTVLQNLTKDEIRNDFVFIQDGFHVHHSDENSLNDDPANLVLMANEDHNRKHALQHHNKLRFIVVPSEVVGITSVGYRQTYDITCPRPMNNYIANGVVVHNSCKSTIALLCIANFQRLFPEKVCVWIDAEWAFDKHWARKLGVNVDLVIVVKPEMAEQAAEMAEGLSYANDTGLVVLDSIAAMTPTSEIEGDIDRMQVGGNAMLVQRMVKKINAGLIASAKQDTYPTFLFLNQLRSKIGVLYGSPDKFPGGKALEHFCNTILRAYAKDKIVKDIAKEAAAIKDLKFTVKKHKVPIISKSFGFEMQVIAGLGNKVGHVDYFNALMNHAKEYGYIAKHTMSKKWVFDGEQYQTLKPIEEILKTNIQIQTDLKAQIIQEAVAKLEVGAFDE